MDAYSILMDVIVIGVGIYFLYLWIRQKKENTIVKWNKLLPTGATAKNCKDVDAYLKEANPFVLLLGICSPIYGGVDLLFTIRKTINLNITMVFLVIYVVLLFSVSFKLMKISKKYWPTL